MYMFDDLNKIFSKVMFVLKFHFATITFLSRSTLLSEKGRIREAPKRIRIRNTATNRIRTERILLQFGSES
jgi:hypothetical protein